jgi:hypothetical protein
VIAIAIVRGGVVMSSFGVPADRLTGRALVEPREATAARALGPPVYCCGEKNMPDPGVIDNVMSSDSVKH